MAGITAQGATFTFKGYVATITAISVESPVAETVDMTGPNDPVNFSVIVPTGGWTGGTITVDYLHAAGGTDPVTLVAQVGTVSFSSAGYSVTKNAILQSVTHGVQVGDLVKGSLKFVLTDYYPPQ